MKNLIIIAATIFSIFIQTNSFADGLKMKEEAYIDDIPFNTTKIFDSCMASENDETLYELKEEAYVDDIPFNTQAIASQYIANSAMAEIFILSEESSIPDIPFNTKAIAEKAIRDTTRLSQWTNIVKR